MSKFDHAVTSILDAIGLLLLAAGLAAATFHVLNLASLGVAGAVILIGSWWAAREPKRKGIDE